MQKTMESPWDTIVSSHIPKPRFLQQEHIFCFYDTPSGRKPQVCILSKVL